MGSETLYSACYIFSDESGIPLYSMSNVYMNKTKCLIGLVNFFNSTIPNTAVAATRSAGQIATLVENFFF